MNILLTNDDGVEAPGLHAAYRALRELGNVHVVAPRSERSACSHMITLRRPVRVERLTHDRYSDVHAVDGTPADCVRVAYAELFGGRIDLVVSGINAGANAGVDVFYSGTVAGAREGAILRIPSVAISQAMRAGLDVDWSAASAVAASLIPTLAREALPGPGFWSINLPAPLPAKPMEQVHRVPVATHSMPMSFERSEIDGGRVLEFIYGASYWLREETGPSDYTTIRDGGIAISAVPLMGSF